LIEKLTSQFFVPLAVGGGIRSIDDCLKLLEHGADKVILNTAGLKSPGLITNIANSIGSQSLVVSIDAKRIDNDTYEVMSDFGRGSTGLSPETWAKSAENLGAGELMLSSIDRDGTLEGYDNILNRMVSDAVRVPVVVSGGAGQWKHFVDAINFGGASGVCTSNIYHFTATSIISAKTYMQKHGINVRT
jgi:cyclase